MEPLLKQLKALPGNFNALTPRNRWMVGGAVAVLVVLLSLVVARPTLEDRHAYVYTNLTTQDATDAALTLKAAGIPFRQEAGGSALSVPGSRVHDARLLLAAAGLPRGGHIGFELFDKGELGVSQFTQKVNLRRALEGELARTISSLEQVHQARVHLTLPENGLHKEDDRDAAAAVVVTLKPGASLAPRELGGIRHLVASAVPGLKAANVNVVDGTGAVLAGGDEAADDALAMERRLERDLERRVADLLEPVVGVGHVMVRASVEMDTRRIDATEETYDPDSAVVRSERTVGGQASGTNAQKGGVAGAAANQPLAPTVTTATGTTNTQNSAQTDETRNYEISKTTTVSRRAAPKISRVSVAVLVDGVDGRPRTDEELKNLATLARRAVGVDDARGDHLEVVSNVFAVVPAPPPVEAATVVGNVPPWVFGAVAAAGVLGLLGFIVSRLLRKSPSAGMYALRPGQSVEQADAALRATENLLPAPAAGTVESMPALPGSPTPEDVMLKKARELAAEHPERAATLLRNWMNPGKAEEAVHAR